MSFQDQPRFNDPSQQNLPLGDAAREDAKLQPDPEMAEGRAGGGRTFLTLVAGGLIVAFVLYGLNAQRPEAAHDSATASTEQTQTTGSGQQDVQQDASTKSGTKGSAPQNQQAQPSHNQQPQPSATTGQGSTDKAPQQAPKPAQK